MKSKEWRQSKQLTLAQMADLLNAHLLRVVKYQNVQNWEKGVKPQSDVIAAYEKVTKGRVKKGDFGKDLSSKSVA